MEGEAELKTGWKGIAEGGRQKEGREGKRREGRGGKGMRDGRERRREGGGREISPPRSFLKVGAYVPKWSPVIKKVTSKVARRQIQILWSQRLAKVSQLALFHQSDNPEAALINTAVK